jgi:hypothetical protein
VNIKRLSGSALLLLALLFSVLNSNCIPSGSRDVSQTTGDSNTENAPSYLTPAKYD